LVFSAQGKKLNITPNFPKGLNEQAQRTVTKQTLNLRIALMIPATLYQRMQARIFNSTKKLYGASPLLGTKIATNSSAMNLCHAKFFLRKFKI